LRIWVFNGQSHSFILGLESGGAGLVVHHGILLATDDEVGAGGGDELVLGVVFLEPRLVHQLLI